MTFPDSFRILWQRRAVQSPNWWKDQYEAAVERVEDRTDDPKNAYWYGPVADHDAIPGESLHDVTGARYTAEEARQIAFELLVLADLLEA